MRFLTQVPASVAKSESSTEMDELFPKALNGFMLVLSSDGNMVYLSENVSDYLGVSQVRLTEPNSIIIVRQRVDCDKV